MKGKLGMYTTQGLHILGKDQSSNNFNVTVL